MNRIRLEEDYEGYTDWNRSQYWMNTDLFETVSVSEFIDRRAKTPLMLAIVGRTCHMSEAP
jgi:hypothetical protein